MKLTKAKRQEIINGYLATTGRNMFVPGEFVDWLSGQPDHEAYDWFFSKSEREAAREYRVALARRFVSDLRISVSVQQSQPTSHVVSIQTTTFPAFVSPSEHRANGGGYHAIDPTDEAHIAELRKQGAIALRSWLRRYSGLLAVDGVDAAVIENIAAALEAGRVEAA